MDLGCAIMAIADMVREGTYWPETPGLIALPSFPSNKLKIWYANRKNDKI